MTGFATYADLKTALDSRVITAQFAGVGPGNAAAPAWSSGWYTGGIPSVGADPAAGSATPGAGGTAYTNDAGGILFPDVATEKFLVEYTVRHASVSPLAVKLVDRLVAVGSIPVNSTGDKDVNSVALPRYTDGVSVECYLEVQTAGTTTAPIVSLSSYTNQDGTGGRAGGTVTFNSTASTKGTLLGPMPLQAGDYGVRSVETINVATAGAGSGAVNVVLVRTLVWTGSMHLQSNFPLASRFSPLPFAHLQRVYDGATLQWFRKGNSSNSKVNGVVRVVVR